LDVLIKMLIVVVVGAIMLTLLSAVMPDLFTSMIDRIRGVFLGDPNIN